MATNAPMDAFRSQSGSVILSERTKITVRNKTKTKRPVASKRKSVKSDKKGY